MSERFDIDLLDDVNPFEIGDDNLIHLFKHGVGDRGVPLDLDILDEVFLHDEPRFYEADDGGEADWLMTGLVQGQVITVPLAVPRSGFRSKCRPIGVYATSKRDEAQYYDDIGRWR